MTGRFLRGAAVGIALLVASAVGAPPASATTFAPLTVEQFTDASTYILEGKVLEVWTELDAERMMVWTRARVQVTTTWKGPDSPTEIIVDSPGGTYGDFSVSVPGQAVFSVDEDVFLFLDDLGGTHRWAPVSKFLGKYSVRRAPGETESYVRTWHPSANDTFDARFMPHPAVEDRLYLEDLREQVQRRLDAGWDGKPIPGLSNERLQQINTLEFRIPR